MNNSGPSHAKGSLTRFILHIHPRLVPEHSVKVTYTWCLGGLALWMFLLETVTGIMLLLHYVPSVSGAYASIHYIGHLAPYGFFLRNLHYWLGQAMVLCVVLHMTRVVATGSYNSPRKLNWVVGVTLLVCTLLVDFTGYLLVWDDRALWALTIARNLSMNVPFVGASFATLLFGPGEFGDMNLVRLYVWHVVLLPGTMVGLMAWHFWRVRADGGISVRL